MSKSRIPQKKKLLEYLRTHTCSRWMASEALNLPIQNVTWYARQLEKDGRLWGVRRDKCAISGRIVWFISSNPNLKDTSQLSLFGGGDYD